MGSKDVLAVSEEAAELLRCDANAFLAAFEEGVFDSKSQTVGWEYEVFCLNDDGIPDLGASGKVQNRQSLQGEFHSAQAEANGEPMYLEEGTPFTTVQLDQEKSLSILDGLGLRPFGCGLLTMATMRDCGIVDGRFDKSQMLKMINPHNPRYLQLIECWENYSRSSNPVDFWGHSEIQLESCGMEAMISSFQLHLSVNHDNAINALNLASMISAPTQAPFVSSPRFFQKTGKADEYRYYIWRNLFPGRTGVANSWYDSIEDYVSKCVNKPQWFASADTTNSMDQLIANEKLGLKNLSLQIGSLWYDHRLKINSSSMTIEERSKGAGSPIDNTSKLVFWTGLMRYYLKNDPEIWKEFGNFRVTEDNARNMAHSANGLVTWFGREFSLKTLILEVLLPKAYEGLKDLPSTEVDTYLTIVESIMKSGNTVSKWIRDKAAKLEESMSPYEADKTLASLMHDQRLESVTNWE